MLEQLGEDYLNYQKRTKKINPNDLLNYSYRRIVVPLLVVHFVVSF
jgi:hypothetical protein